MIECIAREGSVRAVWTAPPVVAYMCNNYELFHNRALLDVDFIAQWRQNS